jgi:hypothetical protein
MRLLSVILLCILFAAACQPQVAPTPTQPPPPPPSNTPAPTNTPEPSPTPLVRETLPPTWTPVMLPSETPTPFYTPFAVLGLPASPACADFGEDFTRNPTSFQLGTAPQVFWRPLPGASGYRILLYGPNGSILFDGVTAESSFTFNASLFTALEVYSWEVIPIDANRVQPCPSSGNVLIASVM